MKSIIFTIILIAMQAYIMPAIAQNEGLNAVNNIELSADQEFVNIKQEKTVIDANLKKQEAACYKKFAVNNCLKDAKTEAQTALNAVKRREIAINDLQRNAKAESDQLKKEKIVVKNAEKSSTSDKASEVKDQTKTFKTAKPAKAIKSDADILVEKNAADKSRADAAQKRLAESNQKQAASQKKTQIKAIKNSQAGANVDKHTQKLRKAEEHKAEVEKSRLSKSSQSKPKSAPLPVPNAAELVR
jgi:colicin import membrane protein